MDTNLEILNKIVETLREEIKGSEQSIEYHEKEIKQYTARLTEVKQQVAALELSVQLLK